MFKQFILYTIFACLLCTACKRHKEIPDDKLEAILEEIYITNAYFNNRFTPLIGDSIDVYTPIFKKYGYAPGDLLFTIENLSKRKSVRLTDIVDKVVTRLEAQSAAYQAQADLLDTIEQRIANRYMTVVYEDTVKHVFNKSGELLKFKNIEIPAKEGKYKIELSYQIDSSDRNYNIYLSNEIVDKNRDKFSQGTSSYSRNAPYKLLSEIEVIEPQDSSIVSFNLFNKKGIDDFKTNITVDSIKITHYIPQKAARDSLYRDMLNYPRHTPKKPSKNNPNDPKDYVTLRSVASGVDQKRDSLLQR